MLAKAFLSHHSDDKAIVEEIANSLSRWHCVFDKFSFHDGVKFDDSITKGLEDSNIFVLIIGKNTLTRDYVKKEIRQAKELFKKNALNNVFSFIISEDIKYEDIPKWMRSIKSEITTDVKHISTVIKNRIEEICESSNNLIIGRDIDLADFESIVIDNSKKSNIYFITGLDGIGRKTFARHILKTKLNFLSVVPIDVNPGDGPLEIAFNIRDRHVLSQVDEEIRLYKRNAKKTVEEKVNFFIETLSYSYSLHEAIILNDCGGMFKKDGSFDDDILLMLFTVANTRNMQLFLSTRRIPSHDLKFKFKQLKPLSNASSTILLSQLANKYGEDSEVITKIALHTGGYPPAIKNAASLIRRYGLNEQHTKTIVDDIAVTFSEYVNSLSINEDMSRIITLLSRYSPLTLKTISKYLNKTEHEIFNTIACLIDVSVIDIVSGNFYEISKPIEPTFSRYLKDSIRLIDHSRVKNILQSTILECGDNINFRLLFTRLITRASLLSNMPYDKDDMFSFVSDIMILATTSYIDREYKKALSYANIVLSESENNKEAFEIAIKSLIHEDFFDDAKIMIQRYATFGKPSMIHYLFGFLNRYEGNFSESISSYNKALENGYYGASIHRELAQCYILISDFKNALKHAKKAYDLKDENIFILDIYATALAKNGKIDEANTIINQMLTVERSDFTLIRASFVELSQGNCKKAYDYAYEALGMARIVSFELIVQAILCCISIGDIKQARIAFEVMRDRFRNKREKIQQALLMSIYLHENDNQSAMLIYNTLKNEKIPFVVNIIKNLIEQGMLQNINDADTESQE